MKAILITLIASSLVILLYSCKGSLTEPEIPNDDDTSHVVIRKPNIYIYPVDEIKLSVKINFPSGGKVIESIPIYDGVWEVFVDTNGLINEEYRYLFYECDVPDLNQKEMGWLVKRENLETFFLNNMEHHGFNVVEINDFIEYWIPQLNGSEYFEIYPQYESTIEKMVTIEFSETPKHFFRLFYFIQGRPDKNIEMTAPNIEIGKREDFFAFEWGVIYR